MKATVVQTDNLRGIRLPKAVLEQCGLSNEADLEIEDGQVVIRPAHRPRDGWEESFADMHQSGDDTLLDGGSGQSTWDEDAWRW